MIDINVSLFIQIANFLILLLLLNIVLYKPLRGMMRQRREKMDGLAADAESNRQRREDAAQELMDGLREAQVAGMERRSTLKNEGTTVESEILAKVHREMDAESAKVAEQIKEQIGQARDALKSQIEGFAESAAEKILGRSVS